MNAVKRCLALFAATLVVGACSGDPTADDAGTGLTIRTTPSVVWMREDQTLELDVEAVDVLGGTAPGNWTATTTGPVTAALDPNYQETSTGGLAQIRRFILTPTAAGEGSVTFTGTAGSVTVPVRIAPDPDAFAVTIGDFNPSLAEIVTATAPAGIRFTPSTAVSFVSGGLNATTNGHAAPAVVSMSADSSQLSFVAAPNAFGRLQFTGVASVSTPGLTTTAISIDSVTMATADTNTFNLTPGFTSNGTLATASFLDTMVLTVPSAEYRFRPSTTVEIFRILAPTTANPTGYTVSNGTATPQVIGINADSTQLRVLLAPGARGRFKVRNISMRTAPGVAFAIRSTGAQAVDLRQSVGGPDTANVAITFSKASPIAEGDTVTAIAPAGMVFLPGVGSIHGSSTGTLSGGDSVRVALISPDSTRVTFRLPPGASGEFRWSNMARRANPAIVWQGRSATTINAVAAPAVVATLTPGTANMNDTVSVALDPSGPYRFRPTSTAEFGVNGLTAASASVTVDSLTLKVLPTPGSTGPLTLTNIRYGALPAFQVKASTASNLTTNAATSLGPDDATEHGTTPVFSRTVTLANGASIGFWDAATFLAPDWLGFGNLGGRGQQDLRVVFTNAGTYSITIDWADGAANTDIDIAFSDDELALVAGAFTGAKPETFSVTVTAGTVGFISAGFWDGTQPSALKIVIRRTA
jgi:hypothetical protein